MAPVWIIILSVYKICYATSELYQPSHVSAKFGEAVALHCTFEEKLRNEDMVWYKQTLGRSFEKVGTKGARMDAIISPEFSQFGFKIDKMKDNIFLQIPNVTKEDEGIYFCGIFIYNTIRFSTGTFLAVTDQSYSSAGISVQQSPVSGSVPAGGSVTLQCNILSESRAAELQVLWIRSAAGESHPELIYTHHNSSHQCEIGSNTHSCVYNLSKSIHSLSDTGTYYCALINCGKILFGNGTKIDLIRPVDPAIIYLGAALGVCVLVIFAQTILICTRRNCEHCSVRLQQDIMTEHTSTQEHNAVELNYAALRLPQKKTKRQGENGSPEDSVYSKVKYSTVTDHSLTS